MPEIEIRQTRSGLGFDVKVKPGARESKASGTVDGALKVEIKAPPEGGKANAELIRLLSKLTGARASDIEISSGSASRRKKIRISGVELETLRKILDNIQAKS